LSKTFKQKAIHEIKQVGRVTLYFLICFGLIIFLKKLFLAEYDIEFYGLSAAILGALLVGKVVLLAERAKIAGRFEDEPLILDIAYKSLVFTLAVAVVLYIEAVIHSYHESGGVIAAAKHVIVSRDVNHIRATLLCVFLSFVGYNTISGIDHRMGKATLFKLFIVKSEKELP
jgi:hypothetical protein